MHFSAGPDDETHGPFGVLAVVPEPATHSMWLWGLGCPLAVAWRRREGGALSVKGRPSSPRLTPATRRAVLGAVAVTDRDRLGQVAWFMVLAGLFVLNSAGAKPPPQAENPAPRLRRRGTNGADGVTVISTVTLLARFLGLSTSVPRAQAVWVASSCRGTTCRIGDVARRSAPACGSRGRRGRAPGGVGVGKDEERRGRALPAGCS